MKIQYRKINLRADTLSILEQANAIIEDYEAQGYTLTLRQLYYQFVSRDIIANKDSEYKRLGGIIADGRYAGLVDWSAIEDRTRNLQRLPHWRSPSDILSAVAQQYRSDMWAEQDYHVEVWVEKEALAGVIAQAANKWAVGYISCRGYMSASEMWEAGQRLIRAVENNKTTVVLHLGDHDPSGIDMSRDIQDRLNEFCEAEGVDGPQFHRLALNMDQIREFNPPPNPAKLTDSRCGPYVKKFGSSSWELDALEPKLLDEMISDAIKVYIDFSQWGTDEAKVKEHRKALLQIARDFDA